MRNNKTTKVVRLSFFLAMGIVLNIIESMLPLPIPVPGVRLGLANLMTLIVLYFYSPKDYVLLGFLRVLIVALLRTGLGSIAFFLSLSGWALSTLIVLIFNLIIKKASIYGLSVSSAIFHSLGQIITVMFIYSLPQMISYLPVLLISSIISGILIAYISTLILKILSKTIKN